MKSRIDPITWMWVTAIVCVLLLMATAYATQSKQNEDRAAFMAGCLQDKKQFECDILWAQTDESKQVRNMTAAMAAGLAIGVMAGSK